ncbi:MAG: outer membrane lipoprotein carrier protein LolA [Elusimicrobia bacterium]|nr:outer membrane lipoprotein carrier protein LolA [Elusimicrobiota bacterium]
MRTLAALLVMSLALPSAAATKGKRPRSKAGAPEVAVSTPSAGTSLPLYPATTETLTVPLVLERFERFDRDLRALSAAFLQSVRSEDTGQTQMVAGTLAYGKKDRLRIEHRTPEAQTLVCDGSRVWVWRPANGQVIRSKLEEWKRSQPLAQGLLDFGNYADLLKRYDVTLSTVSAPDADGHRNLALDLKPRARAGGPGGDFLLTLRLSTRDFFPIDSELRVGSVSARTVFSEVRFNPELPQTQFQFTPPAGADVLDFPASPR